MPRVPGPYIPTLDEAAQLGISDPQTIEMLKSYHAGMAEPISQPTPPPEPYPTMPETPPPGPPPDYQQSPEYGLEPLPEADMRAFGNDYVPDEQMNDLGPSEEYDPDKVEENTNQYSEDQLSGVGGKKDFLDLWGDSELAAALKKQKQGEYMKAAGAMAQAEAESNYLTQLDAKMEQRQKDVAVRELARKKQTEEKMKTLDTAVTAFQEAKIDPKRLWSSAGNGQKAMMALGVALGALGAAHEGPGGKNQALGILQKAIDDDIALQKTEIARLGDVVTMKRNLLQDMRAMFDDERDAEDAARLVMLDQAKLKLQQIGAQYKSGQIQGNMMRTMGDLEAAQAQLKQEFNERAALRALNAGDPDAAYVPKELKPWYVPGYGLAQAGSASDVSEFRKNVVANDEARGIIGRLMQLSAKGSKMNQDDRNEAHSLAKQLQSKIRLAIIGPGAVTDAERAILEEIAPNPMKYLQWPGATKRLQTLDDGLRKNTELGAKYLGLRSRKKVIEER